MPTSNRVTQGKYIAAQKITKIPETILRHNFTFPDYCVENFQCLSYITHTTNNQVKDQYILTKSKNEIESNASIRGLESLFKTKLELVSCDVFTKSERDYEGLIVIQGVPSHGKFIHESSETESSSFEQPLSSFDHCVDVLLKSNKNLHSWIISTVSKTNFIPRFPSSKKLSIILPFIIWLGFLAGIIVFLTNRIQNAYALVTLSPSVEYPILTLIDYLWNDILFIRYSVFLGLFLVVTFLGLALFFNQRRKIKRSLDENPDIVAKRKVEQAKDNHREDMKKNGALKQSFIIVIRGEDKEEVYSELESIKRTIQGIFSGSVFKVTGTVLVPKENCVKKFFRRITNWTVESFWKRFYRVKPFKPTTLSIPRAGSNYFRFIREKKLPGADIVEGLTYKIDPKRTKYGLFLGQAHRRVGEETYPYNIKPQDMVRHGFVFGQTGRGKSFFVFNLLTQLIKYYSDIKFMILDPKGEYARLFAKREDVVVFIIDSEVAPLGINIFKILEEVEENKLIVSKLLREYIITVKGYQAELSAFMEYVINQAIDLVYLEEPDEWHIRTFVLKINQFLDEKAEEKIGWVEKTRLALNARFRELFTGRFKSIFCVKESNLTRELLLQNNIIIQMHKLLLKQEEETLQFLASVITSIIANYLEGLFDFELDVPRYIYVLDELQKLAPKREFGEKSFIASYLEIARAHRVTILGSGQDPDEIEKVFRQAGLAVDFGTHSTIMDKTIFEKDHLRAPEEKEQLTPEQMCFVKLTGERRVLLKVADFDKTTAMDESRLEAFLEIKRSSEFLRANHQFIPISLEDLEGKLGQQRLLKKDLLAVCQADCDNGQCSGFTFSKHKLPNKKIEELVELINDNNFLSFCFREANNKNDLLCVLIHYLGFLLDRKAIETTQAQDLILQGRIFLHEQETLTKRREKIRLWMTEEEHESPYGFDEDTEDFDTEVYNDFD